MMRITGRILIGSLATIILVTGAHDYFVVNRSKPQKLSDSESSSTVEHPSHDITTNTEMIIDTNYISEGSVGMDDLPSMPFYHCGPSYSSSDEAPKELLLLHGMVFTKEDWVESKILPTLCTMDKKLSVTAVDFPASSNWTVLKKLFEGLVKAKVLSGEPLVIVSPSASGRSVVGLLDASLEDTNVATKILKGWIPVACGYVNQASQSALNQINVLNIPVLAIYGNDDKGGKVTSEILGEVGGTNVKVVEMVGGHPVYLDDTKKFIDAVAAFIK